MIVFADNKINTAYKISENTTIDDNGCWIWSGAKYPNGYGSVNTGKHGKATTTHRASYEIYNGEIPDGLHVLHKCDVRACVNPHHLFVGTNRDNIADSMAKGRRKGVKRNRPKGISNKWSQQAKDRNRKLSPELIFCLCHWYDSGKTQRWLADYFGISQKTVSKYVNLRRVK